MTEKRIISFEEYKLPPVGHAVSGAIGSTVANLFIYPLDISTTRLQLLDKEHGLLSVMQSIYRNEGGVRGLYAGLSADTLATVLSSFVYFYCYSALRNIQEKWNIARGKPVAKLNVAQELFLGAEAALISRLFTTPVANVTTRLQTAGSSERIIDIVKDIYQEKGITGFWTGYRASMVLVSNPSITYFVFEKVKDMYLRTRKMSALSSLQVFFISALAKTVATMITYPFIFVRTSMIATKKKDSMVSIFHQVIQRHGLSGLYKGMQAQIIKGFFNQGIMYMIKDRLATYLGFLFYSAMILRMKARQQA